jgi:hypothetical protein
MIQMSPHGWKRCQQRHFCDEDLDFVWTHGQEIHHTGVIFYFLGRWDIPSHLRKHESFRKLEGTTLLVSLTDELITVYRNKTACREIRKKDKRRHTLLPDHPAPASTTVPPISPRF